MPPGTMAGVELRPNTLTPLVAFGSRSTAPGAVMAGGTLVLNHTFTGKFVAKRSVLVAARALVGTLTAIQLMPPGATVLVSGNPGGRPVSTVTSKLFVTLKEVALTACGSLSVTTVVIV